MSGAGAISVCPFTAARFDRVPGIVNCFATLALKKFQAKPQLASHQMEFFYVSESRIKRVRNRYTLNGVDCPAHLKTIMRQKNHAFAEFANILTVRIMTNASFTSVNCTGGYC